jgi:glycosyltransferase involved in cell wall biosynthesis
MRILVVTSYFGPETSVGVLRINAFVRYWTAMGHSVTVITMPFTGELPAALEHNPALTVLQVRPWLIGGRQGGGVQTYSKGVTGWKRSLLRFQYWLKKNYLSNYLDPRLLWWPRAVLAARRLIRRGAAFDALVSTVPSYTAHSAAAVIKRCDPRMQWVADYRDLWYGNPIFPGCAPVRAFERWHERLVLSGADLIVSINAQLVADLRANHGSGRRYVVIPNGIEDAELDAARSAVGRERRRDAGISIVYAGSVLPGLQDPTPFFEAVRDVSRELNLDAESITVTFVGDHAALEDFPIVRDPVVARHLELRGKVPRAEALKLQRDADFLLFLGSQPVSSSFGSTRGVVSGKVFEYLIAGVEVMAVGVTDDMLVAELIRDAQVGEAYGRDAERMKSRLRRALEGEVGGVTPDFAYLEQFRRSLQAGALIEAIQAAR